MSKRFLILILAFGLSTHLAGCSSGASKEDGEVAQSNDSQFSEEGEGDFADDSSQQLDAGTDAQAQVTQDQAPVEGGDTAATGSQDLSLDQQQSLDAQLNADQPPAQENAQAGDLALEPQPLPEEVAQAPTDAPVDGGLPADAPPADVTSTPEIDVPPMEVAEAPPAPPTDDAVFNAPAPAPEPAPAPSAPASFAPLLKVKDAAYAAKDGTNLNRVYVARPGDKLKGVSKKIYGEDRSKDLKKWNGFLSRGVRTGDKIYYSSPRDAQDTRMLTYYEDMGIQPREYTTAKEGEDLRKLSKELLGSKDTWKEIWATNLDIESKGSLPVGTKVRYWPESDVVAEAAPAPAAPAPEAMPPADAMPTEVAQNAPPSDFGAPPSDMPPMDPPTMAATDPMASPSDFPSNPPPDLNASNGTVQPIEQAPPPPPPIDQAPPPPPPPVVPKLRAATDEGSTDPDTMMAMGFGGILLIAAAVLYVAIKRNRNKRVDLGQTQV